LDEQSYIKEFFESNESGVDAIDLLPLLGGMDVWMP
jgi:hypothetical protein